MPVNWPFAEEIIRLGGTGRARITEDDASRQRVTAIAILEELRDKPGIVLADEVGMGKTYVALAVIASVLLATRNEARPVVVMVPRGLITKWQRDWDQFKSANCEPSDALSWVRATYAKRPTEFFKALGRPPSTRPHIIWLDTRCFHHGLADPWVKLALVRLARGRTRLNNETKKRIYKWATALVRLQHNYALTPEVVATLLDRDVTEWQDILRAKGIVHDEEDVLPPQLMEHRRAVDWTPLTKVLRRDLPGRRGSVSAQRLAATRKEFNVACGKVYRDWLRRMQWRAPLLVLDEAHHAKNDNTHLASLFRDEETKDLLLQTDTAPLLHEKFDRLLFLTATPFQLGHEELVRVLRSFNAAKWSGESAPKGDRSEFGVSMKELERRLGAAREAARHLDRRWGDLAYSVVTTGADDEDIAAAAAAWWCRVRTQEEPQPGDRPLLDAIRECQRLKSMAELDREHPWSALRSWVIRHNRAATSAGADGNCIERRQVIGGRAISDDAITPSGPVAGLSIAQWIERDRHWVLLPGERDFGTDRPPRQLGYLHSAKLDNASSLLSDLGVVTGAFIDAEREA